MDRAGTVSCPAVDFSIDSIDNGVLLTQIKLYLVSVHGRFIQLLVLIRDKLSMVVEMLP
jgi:hypothetical protein